MKILISGASGLVGGELLPRLREARHDLAALLRPGGHPVEGARSIGWLPESGQIDQQTLERWGGAEAVVHLAGENIAGRWTAKRKRRIRQSRVEGTRRLCESLLRSARPEVFISASAVGFYGNRGEEILTEESSLGTGFLAEVTRDWEGACEPMRAAGVRVVNLRFGLILSARGGALQKMLPAFRIGMGGRLGTGRQWMSWVSVQDVVRISLEVLQNPEWSGPINVVAPNPVRNEEFTSTLGRVLRRPTFLSVPAFALRLLFGEMADEGLLTSQRAMPQKLERGSFAFARGNLEGALRDALSNDNH